MTGEAQSGSEFADFGGRALTRRVHDEINELLARHEQMERLLRVISEIGSEIGRAHV